MFQILIIKFLGQNIFIIPGIHLAANQAYFSGKVIVLNVIPFGNFENVSDIEYSKSASGLGYIDIVFIPFDAAGMSGNVFEFLTEILAELSLAFTTGLVNVTTEFFWVINYIYS